VPYTGNVNDGYITQDDGHLHVWDGVSWNDVGQIKGPTGPTGISSTGDITFNQNIISSTASDIVFGKPVVPSSDAAIDLGTTTARWRSLYVSSNTIYIGNAEISASGSNLFVGGSEIPTVVQALPPGGITGQILAKASNADYDVVWIDPPATVLSLSGGSPEETATSTVDGGDPTGSVITSIVDGGTP
jgi:hypothetical protein